MKIKGILAGTAMLVTAGVMLAALQRLFQPKYMSDVVEGNLIADYYNSGMNHQVLFVGDCEVYENFSPVTLWEEYGISSYIRGSAQQLIWQSYYLLEDTLRYEKPDVVIFNVLSMKYGEPQNEAYNRMSIEGMRWSKSKIDNIKASMTEEESFLSYVFPILRYHSRWSELTEEDFRYYFDVEPNFFGGYYMRADVKPAENVPTARPLTDYAFSENSWNYLEKMMQLCAENHIKLILIKAPSLYPFWYDQWDQQIEEFAEQYHLPYINFLDENMLEQTGIDFAEDTYDGGLHMNVYGAEKLSCWMGDYLVNRQGVRSHSDNQKLAEEWSEISERYYAELNRQLENLELYGNVRGEQEEE
ncbi:MAG: SGNH/GDSL hydrolase family protein [Oscillospiraceae bacterium]|nr:SGNH/GDSL hydrolase family protein [Oscillospiraceae bacterium]